MIFKAKQRAISPNGAEALECVISFELLCKIVIKTDLISTFVYKSGGLFQF